MLTGEAVENHSAVLVKPLLTLALVFIQHKAVARNGFTLRGEGGHCEETF